MEFQETKAVVQSDNRWLSTLDFLWLEVTRRCNLRCVHCYANSSNLLPLVGKMRYEDWRQVLEEGASLGCRAVQFIGGEPTLYPHLTRLIADARALDYKLVEVFTNGTLLSDSLFKTFRQFGVCLAFSVYAHKTEVHESITRREGSFQRTLDGIRHAREYGLRVRAGIVLMDANNGDLEETRAMLLRMGVATISVDRLRGIGRGDAFIAPHASEFDELCGSCWKGKLRVDPDGRVSPCIFSDFYLVGSVDEGLERIVNGARLQDFRQRVRYQASQRDDCVPDLCSPDTCKPADRPCDPDCAPACSPCNPDLCSPSPCAPSS